MTITDNSPQNAATSVGEERSAGSSGSRHIHFAGQDEAPRRELGDLDPDDFQGPRVTTSSSRQRDGVRHSQLPKLSFCTKVIAGSGHILNDLCASLWFTYFLFYMQSVVGFTDRNAALLMLLGQIVDGVATPLIGYEADRANHCWLCRRGYGRCKSWHLMGVILVSVSFPFVFSPCIKCEDSQQWARALYYGPFIAIFQIGWASSQISHLALIPKLSPDVLIRTELLAIRYAFTVASNITVFLLTWALLGLGNCIIDSSDAYKFRDVGLIAVGIGGFFSFLFHFLVTERSDEEIKRLVAVEVEAEQEPTTSRGRRRGSLVDSLNTITNVRSVSSSMAISKVQAQAKRRRSPSSSSADREVGTPLLSDQDELEVSGEPDHDYPKHNDPFRSGSAMSGGSRDIQGPTTYNMEGLSSGKERVKVSEWMMMPQFYIVAIMYMATRININVTQVYVPLYLQESLELECGSVATIPLTMYCSGFVVSIFIKLINKYLGRLLSYSLGAVLCTIGAGLILFLNWTPEGTLATKGIYGIAALLGGGASAILVTSLSITADMIGNNVESGAFVYGAMSFCDKVSCGLAIMLINELKGVYGDKGFYQRVLGYTAGGCSIVGVLGVTALTYIIYRQRRNTGNT